MAASPYPLADEVQDESGPKGAGPRPAQPGPRAGCGRATGARALAAALSLAAGVLAGCASVDAHDDLLETSQLVRERTGSTAAWDPDSSEQVIREAVEEMLADGLTVAEAVRVALLWNPGLRASFEEVGIRKAELVAAGLPSNPAFAVSARFPEGGGPVNVTASLSQSLLDLFLIGARQRAGEARLSMARWQVVRDALLLTGRVERQAFDLIALGRGREVARESRALAERSLAVAERRRDAGLGDAVDVALANTALLAARRELMLIERDVAVRRAGLGELMGLPPLATDWHLEDELPAPRTTESAEELVRTALARRLDIEVARLRVEAARGNLDLEQTARLGNVSLGFEREVQGSTALSGPGLGGTLPLWNQNQPGTARARFELARALDELRGARNAAAREVREALAEELGTRRVVALFEHEILPGVQESVDASERSWLAGERDILVVLAAQRALLEQRREYVGALRDAARARSSLDVALGGLGQGAASAPDSRGQVGAR